MFYSHEVLTSRKHGVATVWLVATLGSRSSLKKVNRKAILDVNVPKACETILAPEAPMALRLQSNLLYGVTRVYLQQCTYILADCQNAHNSIRASLHVLKTATLDPEAGRSMPDQLLLRDDPSFLPQFALEPLDLDPDVGGPVPADQGDDNALSPHSMRRSMSITLEDHLERDIGRVVTPTRDMIAGRVDETTFAASNGARANNSIRELGIEDNGFDADADFAFDAEGNLVERSQTKQPQHEAGDDAMEVDLPSYGDEVVAFNAASPSTHTQPQDSPQETQPSEEGSAVVVLTATQRSRNRKAIQMDDTTTLRNNTISSWSTDYIQNMADASQHRLHLRVAAQAKKNAEYWVLGLGVGGVGAITGSTGIPGPLDMFRGEALAARLGLLTGHARKRQREETSGDESPERRVRHRSEEQTLGRENDGDVFFNDEEEIEMARQAPEEMLSQHSQHLPWTVTVSARASSVTAMARNALGFPSSVAAPGSISTAQHLGRREPSYIQPSPLDGRRGRLRSAASPSRAEDAIEDTLGTLDADITFAGSEDVDQSELAHAQFDQQTVNFGEFIFETMQKKKAGDDDEAGEVDKHDEVLFGELIRPESNTKTVAAQGFMHLLGLATQGRITVQQDEPYSDIAISLPFAGSL